MSPELIIISKKVDWLRKTSVETGRETILDVNDLSGHYTTKYGSQISLDLEGINPVYTVQTLRIKGIGTTSTTCNPWRKITLSPEGTGTQPLNESTDLYVSTKEPIRKNPEWRRIRHHKEVIGWILKPNGKFQNKLILGERR